MEEKAEIKVGRFFLKIKGFNEIAKIDEIARRYFALNSFDGVLMILGILIASLFASIYDYKIITITCIGAAVAVTISGMWGAYLTEHAERTGNMKNLEKQIGFSLKKTPIHKAHKFAALVLALINGFSSLIAALLIISPFFFPSLDIRFAYFLAICLAFLILFLIGMFLGKISKTNLFVSGLRIVIAGVVCSVVIILLEKLRGI